MARNRLSTWQYWISWHVTNIVCVHAGLSVPIRVYAVGTQVSIMLNFWYVFKAFSGRADSIWCVYVIQISIKIACIELCGSVHTAQRQIPRQIPIGSCTHLIGLNLCLRLCISLCQYKHNTVYSFPEGCVNSYALFTVQVYPGDVTPMMSTAPPLHSNGTC